jgi:hypothetical protein
MRRRDVDKSPQGGRSRSERPYAPWNPTADPINPAMIKANVARRIRRGVRNEKPFALSHARVPVTPAPAVIVPIMHCIHMGGA